MPAFDLAVGLGIERGSSDVSLARNADQLLEVASDELWAVVRSALLETLCRWVTAGQGLP